MAAFDVDQCREELCMEYEHNKGKVSLFPFDNESRVDIEDIFVNLELLEETSKPDQIKRVKLKSYSDLFSLTNKKEANQPVVRVLVKGGPGSGKTTLAEKIAYDWAQSCRTQSSEGLGKFQLLFVLYLRDIDKDMTLEDAIFDQLLSYDTQLSKQSLSEYLRLNADKIAIIFDGADEYSGDFVPTRLKSTIAAVVSYKLLRKSHVVVTTRPNRVGEFSEYARVELMGFDRYGIITYIKKFFQVTGRILDYYSFLESDSDSDSEISDEDETMVQKNHSDDATKDKKRKKKVAKTLYNTIYESPSLVSMVHIPVILTMICLLWKGVQKLPTRMTELYQEFTHYLTQRWFEKSTTEIESEELEANIMVPLGKIALKCLFEDRLFFTSNEFHEQDALVKACLIGIVTQERKRSKLRMVKHFTFLHKTFQEYCAASYWVSLIIVSSDQFLSYLRRLNHQNVHDFEYLLVFSCGLSDKAADMILAHVASIRYEGACDEVMLSLADRWWRLGMRLLYESQSHSYVRHLVSWLKSTTATIKIDISDNFTKETYLLFDYFTTSLKATTWTMPISVMLEITSVERTSMFNVEVIVRYEEAEDDEEKYETDRKRTSNIVNCLLNLLDRALREVNLKFDIRLLSLQTIKMTSGIISNISSKHFQLLHIDLPPFSRKSMLTCWIPDDYDHNIDMQALGESIGCLPAKFFLKISALGPDDISSLLEGITSVSSPSPIVGFVSSCCTFTANSLAKVLSRVQQLYTLSIKFQWRKPNDESFKIITAGAEILEILTPTNSSRFLRVINTGTHGTHSLRTIDFSGVHIGEAAYHIHRLLPSLQKLSLCFAEMDWNHCGSLFSKLTKSHDLHTLILTGNKVGLEKSNNILYVYSNASVMLKYAFEYLKALTSLGLASTSLTPGDICHVAEGLVHLRSLRDLDLSKNEIMYACPYLAKHLQQLTNLRRLELQETYISDDGAISLARSFIDLKHLAYLDISRNEISCKGTYELSRSFHHLKQLSVLDISHNPIKDIGIVSLCESFQSTPHLIRLNVENCGISSTGALVLAMSFQFLPSVEELNLDRNMQIGPEGISWLFENIHVPKSLKCLSLHGIEVKECSQQLRIILNALGWKQNTSERNAVDDGFLLLHMAMASPELYKVYSELGLLTGEPKLDSSVTELKSLNKKDIELVISKMGTDVEWAV